jgi:hypothetical protein
VDINQVCTRDAPRRVGGTGTYLMHMHTFVTCFKHRTSVFMAAYPARPLQLILTLNSLTDDPGSGQVKGQWLAGMRVDASAVYHFKHPLPTEGYSHRILNYPLTLLSGPAATVPPYGVRCLCNVSSRVASREPQLNASASNHRMLPR